MRKFSASDNKIEKFPEFPDCTESINLSKNMLTNLGNLPVKLNELMITHNNIIGFTEETFKKVEKLRTLIAHHNNFEEVKYVPNTVTKIDVSDSEIKHIGKLPEFLIEADFSNNKISEINLNREWPKNMIMMDIRRNSKLNVSEEVKEKLKRDQRFRSDFDFQGVMIPNDLVHGYGGMPFDPRFHQQMMMAQIASLQGGESFQRNNRNKIIMTKRKVI